MDYTVDQIMEHVKALTPRQAAALRNGHRQALVRTQVYESVVVEGGVKRLARKDGRIGLGYIRVSTRKGQEDGFSSPEQAAALVRAFIEDGEAFCLVSDAGLSGGLAYDSPELIAAYRREGAASYERAFRAVFLSDPAETQENREGLESYLREHLERIRKGGYLETEEEILAEGGRKVPARSPVHFRGGLTVVVEMLPQVHKIRVTDWSRVSRSELVTADLLPRLEEFGVQVVGVYQNLEWLRRGDLGAKLLAVVYAHQYAQTRFDVLLGSLRGIKQKLATGQHHSSCPSWIRRDGKNGAVYLTEIADVLREGVELYASDPELGLGGLAAWLNAHIEGGRYWTDGTVAAVLENPALVGDQLIFGKRWPCFPPLISDEVWKAVQEKRKARAEERKRVAQTGVMREWLLSGVLKCWCGYALNSRNKAASGGANREYYGCTNPRKLASEKHGRVRKDLMEEFFHDLMAGHSVELVDAVLGDGDEAAIAAELRAAEEEQVRGRARRGDMRREIEAVAASEVRDRFRLAGSSPVAVGMVALLVADRTSEFEAEEREEQARVNMLRRALTDLKAAATVDDTRRVLVRWSEMDNVERNAAIKRVFSVVQLRRDWLGFDPVFPGLHQPAHVVPMYFDNVLWRGRRVWKLVHAGRWVSDMIGAEESEAGLHDTGAVVVPWEDGA